MYALVINTSILEYFHKEVMFGHIKLFKLCHYFIEVPVPSPEKELSCIYVLRVSIVTLSAIFLLDFLNGLAVWYFLFFILFANGRGRDRIAVGFTTAYAISTYHN